MATPTRPDPVRTAHPGPESDVDHVDRLEQLLAGLLARLKQAGALPCSNGPYRDAIEDLRGEYTARLNAERARRADDHLGPEVVRPHPPTEPTPATPTGHLVGHGASGIRSRGAQ